MTYIFYEIKSRLTIQEIMEHYGIQTLDGKQKLPCPFHNERTPSFKIYPETNSFFCFSCGAGGDQITFVKLFFNLKSNLNALEKIDYDFALNLFKDSSNTKLNQEIKEKIQYHHQCEFKVKIFEDWKSQNEEKLLWFFKALLKITQKTIKNPLDPSAPLYAFAKNNINYIEDMLDVIQSNDLLVCIHNYKKIEKFINDMAEKWNLTIKECAQ